MSVETGEGIPESYIGAPAKMRALPEFSRPERPGRSSLPIEVARRSGRRTRSRRSITAWRSAPMVSSSTSICLAMASSSCIMTIRSTAPPARTVRCRGARRMSSRRWMPAIDSRPIRESRRRSIPSADRRSACPGCARCWNRAPASSSSSRRRMRNWRTGRLTTSAPARSRSRHPRFVSLARAERGASL